MERSVVNEQTYLFNVNASWRAMKLQIEMMKEIDANIAIHVRDGRTINVHGRRF